MSHLRYPEDLFKVQRNLLAQYHVTDAGAVLLRPRLLGQPERPDAAASPVPQPPYYLTLQMPDQDEAAFSLTSTFIPARQQRRATC